MKSNWGRSQTQMFHAQETPHTKPPNGNELGMHHCGSSGLTQRQVAGDEPGGVGGASPVGPYRPA